MGYLILAKARREDKCVVGKPYLCRSQGSERQLCKYCKELVLEWTPVVLPELSAGGLLKTFPLYRSGIFGSGLLLLPMAVGNLNWECVNKQNDNVSNLSNLFTQLQYIFQKVFVCYN